MNIHLLEYLTTLWMFLWDFDKSGLSYKRKLLGDFGFKIKRMSKY